MTNLEFADTLERLAVKYRENESIRQVMLYAHVYEKDAVLSIVKGLGGKWTKTISNDSSEYATVRFDSVEFAPMIVSIPRDKVCRRTIQWDCEPLLKPEDEAEILAEVEGK